VIIIVFFGLLLTGLLMVFRMFLRLTMKVILFGLTILLKVSFHYLHCRRIRYW